MGCWSENCVVSGLEIRHGDPCGIFYIGADKDYRGRPTPSIKSPIIWGEYNDYGGIEEVENAEKYIASGLVYLDDSDGVDYYKPSYLRDNQVEDDTDYKDWPVFVHKDIFNIISSIPTDMGFLLEDGIENTIGNYVDHRLKKVKEGFASHLASLIVVKEEANSEIMARIVGRFLQSDWQRGLISKWSKDALSSENFDISTDTEFLMNMVRDELILSTAMSDLRRGFPMDFHGPQHGGADALKILSEEVLKICNNRLEDYEE